MAQSTSFKSAAELTGQKKKTLPTRKRLSVLAYHASVNGYTVEWQRRMKIKPILPLKLIWFCFHDFFVILPVLQSSIHFQVKQDR